ncbi:collagenase [Kitasatospora sp. NA04385]|uniref:collagenase n=1 Tax=Kitasatospora sp. NA04385 TaxID=2742135 RepID=UPI0015909846|nr:collagenase [Kitasatospora sp. NA04385]QKW22500.1 collagenase [Kitasatospora sp. NA04385]
MRLRIPLPTLAAGLLAGCTVAATLLPVTPAAAATGGQSAKAAAAAVSAPASAADAAAPGGAVPKPLGPIVDAAPESLAPVAAPLPPALLGQVQMGQPQGTAVQTTPRPAQRNAGRTPAVKPPGAPGATGSRATTATTAAAAAPTATAAPAQSCTYGDFGSRSGADLVNFVKSSTSTCVSTLYNVTGTDAGAIFKQANMLTVANAFKGLATAYDGTDGSGILQLVQFLRAGYYVQSYYPAAVGAYDASLTAATRAGLDAFFAGTRWKDVTDANGTVLYDVLVLTDSANLQATYLNVYQQVLNGYGNGYNATPKMVNAVNAVLFAPLWRGNWNADFVTAIGADTGLVTSLGNFALNHRDLLGTSNAFLDVNAGNDIARMAGTSTAVENAAKPLIKQLLDTTRILGDSGPLYVHVAFNANTYDKGQCSYYGTCDLPTKLADAVLPNVLVCDNKTLRAQALTAAQLQPVCDSLRGEDAFFHRLVKDDGPVPNQYGKTLVMPVFAGATDYQTYSWAIYGNSTDNGGQTVMDVTDPNNQPVCVMYQKSWNDDFAGNVWNLNHEYTHYLDNIYDMTGDFATEISVPDIWWIEGVAEYQSYAYRGVTDTQAMAEAAKHTYKLSTIFQNTYDNADSTRVYPWGYLAVRYMFEKHPADVSAMLGRFRTGDYQGGYAVYNGLGTSYDADFDAWLTRCADGACFATGPTALFDQSVSGATVTLTDRSVVTGSPAQITGWHWTFGDGSSSDQRNPSHTYAKAGTYTVALTVTDANGRTTATPASVTTTVDGGSGPTTLPTCTDQRTDAMGRNCRRTGRTRTAGSIDYLYVYLPAGTSTLKVTANGGTGTAYLYYNADTWASPSAFTASSTNQGTAQTVTVTNPTAGYRYLSLYAVTDFSDVTISTQF